MNLRHGCSLGQWSDDWDATPGRAADGHYLENGRISYQKRRGDVAPNTAFDGAGDPGAETQKS